MTQPQEDRRRRELRAAVAMLVVGVLVLVALVVNIVVAATADEPATSSDLDRFVACIQNVVFAPELVDEVRADTVGRPRPAAGAFCDRLAVKVRAAAADTTPTATTSP